MQESPFTGIYIMLFYPSKLCQEGRCFLLETYWGKATVVYAMPQYKKKGRLGGDRDQIKFIDLKFERWQVVGF